MISNHPILGSLHHCPTQHQPSEKTPLARDQLGTSVSKKMHMPQYIISDSLRFSNITFSGGYIAVNHAESAKKLQCHPDGMMWGLPTPSWSSFSSNASDH
jgi:hypothetical protein